MTRVRGKKGGKILEATMDSISKKNFVNLKDTKCLILVSIKGNEYCTDEYLQSMIEKSLNDNGEVCVLVADEVYWHNLRTLSGSDDENKLKNEALRLGDEFLSNNFPFILKALNISQQEYESACGGFDINKKIQWINDRAQAAGLKFELLRWQEWLTRDGYSEQAAEIEGLYESVDGLKESIDETALDFARRHQQEGDEALWLYRSRAYLKEESPAVMWCSMARGYQFIAYPGSIIAPMAATKKFFTGDDLPESVTKFKQEIDPCLIGHWLDVHFKRSPGHVVSNINPKAYALALEKAGLFKARVQENESVESLVHDVTSAVLSDGKIAADLKVQVLISLLGKLEELQQLEKVKQVKVS